MAAALAASAFWRLCCPRSDAMPARSAKGPSGPVHGALLISPVPLAYQPCGDARVGRDDVDPGSIGEPQALGNIAAPVVVIADDRVLGLLHQPRLQAGVVLHGAVAVEVIGRDVEQDADGGLERRRQLDLERGHFDDVGAVVGRRLQRQDGGADVAAHLRIPAGFRENVRDQGGRRRFAVGAGDGDERRIRRALGPLAREQLDVADDLDAGGAGFLHGPVRLGMRERHARRQHERREPAPVGSREILDRYARVRRSLPAGGTIVCRNDRGAAGHQGAAARHSGHAEPEDRNSSPGEGGDRRHRGILARVA